MTDDLTQHRFATPGAFADWLRRNDDTSTGIWLVVAKKGSPMATITHRQALLVALRHGWIDAQALSLDADGFLQRFCPRRKGSNWSARNREYVEAMIAEGTMAPRGLAEVERAKENGRWEAAYANR
jgi:uncharacterized protein YdeI (YjbR/CyaY-like superfamily)